MTNLAQFQFNTQSIRVVTLDGEPWFVAKDVCDILELGNVAQSLARLDDDEQNTIILNDGNRGNPNTSVISESGLYALVLSSRKPQARPFRKWVTSEVLPTIRKTGRYEVEPQPAEPLDIQELDLLRLGLKSLKPVLQDGFILNRLGHYKPALLPDIKEAHKVLAAHNDIPTPLLSPTAIAKELGIKSAIKVNRLLCEMGYQYKNTNKSTKGEPDWLPTEKGKEFVEVTLATGHDRDNSTYQHLKWHREILDVLEPVV